MKPCYDEWNTYGHEAQNKCMCSKYLVPLSDLFSSANKEKKLRTNDLFFFRSAYLRRNFKDFDIKEKGEGSGKGREGGISTQVILHHRTEAGRTRRRRRRRQNLLGGGILDTAVSRIKK